MDFLLEVFVEVVGRILIEVIAELLIRVGIGGVSAVVRNWVTRFVLTLVVGFVAGVVWAGELAERGHTERPRLFFVSLGIAAVSGGLAFYRWRRDPSAFDEPDGLMSVREALADIFMPWRWNPIRLASFAALNVSIAAGVAVGYDPL